MGLGFLWLLKRVLPSTVPCSFFSKIGLDWVPGKNKKSAGLLWSGEHMGTGDCPELVHGLVTVLWLPLQKTFALRSLDIWRMQVSTFQAWVCV